MTTASSTVAQYIADRTDYWIDQLITLLRQPSVSAQNLGVRECAELLLRMMREHGIEARLMETAGYPVVYGEAGDGDRTILMYNHYDVQPPDPLELWDSPPFEPTIRDGKLYARGAADDKAHLVSRFAALEAFRAVHPDTPFRVKFLFEGEEEVGSPNLEPFIRDHADLLAADGTIWEGGGADEENRCAIFCGLRGFVTFELFIRTMKYDAHSGEQYYLPNACWRLIWALASLKDVDERILVPGFLEGVRPPTARQRELMRASPSLEEVDRAFYQPTRMAGNLTGEALVDAIFVPSLNLNGIWGGYSGEGAMNIIPCEAGAKLDLRILPDQDPERMGAALREHLDRHGFDDVEIRRAHGERAAMFDPDDPFVLLSIETAREVYGAEPVVTPITGGSGPGYPFLQYLGTPFTCVGVGYMDCLGHAPNENLRLSDWLPGTLHLARIFEEFFGAS